MTGIYVGAVSTVSDMQGPCPDGFHVPTNTEWSAVYSIGINLGLWTSGNGNGVKTYLKLPFMGTRQYTNGATNRQGSEVVYWCCDSHSSYTGYANTLYASGTLMESSHYNQKALGAGIRPFKDSAVTPSGSGWVALYSNRVYWNSSLGLISISSDGSTWYTLADKNVGATTVYNNGDALTQDNCGKYYQWGNNYGFPYIGSITTSSAQVNASTYGPGNYYSSSTFILINGGWDSSDNKNLRGGVSQGTTEKGAIKNIYVGTTPVKEVYVGTTKVRPTGWKPGANTLGYYPLNGDLKDYSGNNRDLTGSGVTYTSGGPGQVGVFSGGATAYYTNNSLYNISYPFTYSAYVYFSSITSSKEQWAVYRTDGGTLGTYDKCLGKSTSGQLCGYNYYNGGYFANGGAASTGVWYHLVYTYDGSTQKIYKNGSLAGTNACGGSYTGYSNACIRISSPAYGGVANFAGRISNVIIENKVRTAQEISDYYNQTKANYGL